MQPNGSVGVMPRPRAGAPPAAVPAGPPHPVAAAEPRSGYAQKLVYIVWFIALFEPHRLLEHYGPDALGKLQFLFYGLLALQLVIRQPKRDWAIPLGVFLAYTLAIAPFAYNTGLSRQAVKVLLLFYVLVLGTVNYIRTPREARPIIGMLFFWQLFWWEANGIKGGLVPWHGDLGNYDSYGPLMAIGIGLGIYFAMGARATKYRVWGYLAAMLAVGGVVSSFARGAVIATAGLMVILWLRSPRKGRMTVAMIAASAVVVVFAILTEDYARGGDPDSPKGFFNEMKTMFDDNSSSDNGSDRKFLWSAAWRIYLKYPVFGVGANNFGPVAANTFRPGEVGGVYADNPFVLYSRALHSSYFQILCEYGTVGSVLFLWLIWDFWRRNRILKSSAYVAAWNGWSGGEWDLKHLALGLEAGMFAFLATALFYNQLWMSWMYTLLACNLMFYTMLTPVVQAIAARGAVPAGGRAPAPTPSRAMPPRPAAATPARAPMPAPVPATPRPSGVPPITWPVPRSTR